jgi:hypothetical protein
MRFHESSGGLRHNPRHKFFDDLINLDLGKYLDGHDPTGKAILEKAKKVLSSLSENQRVAFVFAAQTIFESERAKEAWNPKVEQARYHKLAKVAVAAARLASEISELVSLQDWVSLTREFPTLEDRLKTLAPIGGLVSDLVAFAEGSLYASEPTSTEPLSRAHSSTEYAHRVLSAETGRMHWELLRDLVWLALERPKGRLSERTVRRYLDKPVSPPNPARRIWVRGWPALRNAAKLAPNRDSEPFELALRTYLNRA